MGPPISCPYPLHLVAAGLLISVIHLAKSTRRLARRASPFPLSVLRARSLIVHLFPPTPVGSLVDWALIHTHPCGLACELHGIVSVTHLSKSACRLAHRTSPFPPSVPRARSFIAHLFPPTSVGSPVSCMES